MPAGSSPSEQFYSPLPQTETPPADTPEVTPTNPFTEYLNDKLVAARDQFGRLKKRESYDKHASGVRETVRQFAKDIGIDIEQDPELKAKFDKLAQEQPNVERESDSFWKPYYEAEVARLEALQQRGDPEELREEIEADFRAALHEYAREQEHLDWLHSVERFDYAQSDADILAAKKQELKGITGQSEADNQQRVQLMADIKYINENSVAMEESRKIHNDAVEYNQQVADKLTKLLQLRQELPTKLPATSPNVLGR
jgi:hypothetical protein